MCLRTTSAAPCRAYGPTTCRTYGPATPARQRLFYLHTAQRSQSHLDAGVHLASGKITAGCCLLQTGISPCRVSVMEHSGVRSNKPLGLHPSTTDCSRYATVTAANM